MRPTAWLASFVFVGAALLFAMEPMVGRLLLPSFGGAFHVWTTALMFFQGALFVGYLYAHLVAPRLGKWHFVLLLAAVGFLPFQTPAPPDTPSLPTLIGTLIAHFGVPFVALASTSVVAQQWLVSSTVQGREDPYRLYASSNAGSLLALLGYVLLLEPLSGLRIQGWGWAAAYVGYLLVATIAFVRTKPLPRVEQSPRPPWKDLLYWTFVAAAPSALSMGLTNVFMLDVGNAPLVWVLPLTIYLLTFIFVFGRAQFDPEWLRRVWPHIAVVGLVAFFLLPGVEGISPIVHLGVLFFVGSAAHAELHRTRPSNESLTWFYLALSLGGLIGAAVVAVIAPYVFRGLWEYPLALVSLLLVIGYRHRAWKTSRRASRILFVGFAAACVLVVVLLERDAFNETTLAYERSPYGIYTVDTDTDGDEVTRRLLSGRTVHGRQRIVDGELVVETMSYYHIDGPLGDVLGIMERPRRIGAVGLGVGIATAHLEPNEHITFHEIDPLVVALARRHFTFLDVEADVQVKTGDARQTLADEQAEGVPPYQVLLVDAFSGDATPLHLLTREAIDLYHHRVGDGLIAFHISSRYVDLEPVVSAAAESVGLDVLIKREVRSDELSEGEDPSMYMVAGRAEQLAPLREMGWDAPASPRRLLTDDRASVLSLWKWRNYFN